MRSGCLKRKGHKPLFYRVFSFHKCRPSVSFQYRTDNTDNRLEKHFLWSRPSESSSFCFATGCVGMETSTKVRNAVADRQMGHMKRKVGRDPHSRHSRHSVVQPPPPHPLASSVALQSKETPDLFHYQEKEWAPFFCTTCLWCNTLYRWKISFEPYSLVRQFVLCRRHRIKSL